MINSLSTQQINLNAEALPRSPVHVHTNHSLLCIINSQFTIKTFHTMETLRLSKKPKKLPFRTIGSKKWRKQTYPKVAILWRLTPSGEFFSHFWPFLGHYWLFSQKPLTSRGLHYYGMILLYIWVRFKNFPPLVQFSSFKTPTSHICVLETWTKYLSKLTYISLSQRFTELGCECKNVVQTCPELTLVLPICPCIFRLKINFYSLKRKYVHWHPVP